MGFLEIILENRTKGGKRKPFDKPVNTMQTVSELAKKVFKKKKNK